MFRRKNLVKAEETISTADALVHFVLEVISGRVAHEDVAKNDTNFEWSDTLGSVRKLIDGGVPVGANPVIIPCIACTVGRSMASRVFRTR